jgi:SAM-dependent methyltransferase
VNSKKMLKFHKKTIYEALGREPVHPFPARMAPGIALAAMPADSDQLRVLDPMMGSGTVLAMARARGHRGFGFDLDPLAVLISKVWTTANDPEEVREASNEVLTGAKDLFSGISEEDAYPPHADEETRNFLTYWFDPQARRQLTALSNCIACIPQDITRNVLWCAYSRLIITKQAGASLARDLAHSRPHRFYAEAPLKPFEKFPASVERVLANTISAKSGDRGPAPTIHLGDARKLPVESGSIDLVLTSPPYLNAIDYLRCSKFSLVWMGESVSGLRQVRCDSVGAEAAKNSTADDPEVARVMKAMKLKPRLAPQQERILGRYIDDMRDAISEVGRVLADKGKAVYVVGENTVRGTYIRNSTVLCELAEMAGLTLDSRRTRTLPANRRYMPPPAADAGTMDVRMRREVVLTFTKQ